MRDFPDSTSKYSVELALGDTDQDILAKARAARNRELVDLRLAQGLAAEVVNAALSRHVAEALMAGARS